MQPAPSAPQSPIASRTHPPVPADPVGRVVSIHWRMLAREDEEIVTVEFVGDGSIIFVDRHLRVKRLPPKRERLEARLLVLGRQLLERLVLG